MDIQTVINRLWSDLYDFVDPPSKLSITGYEEGTTITAGTVLKLMCTALSGNPLPTLTWYKNDRKVREFVQRIVIKLVVADYHVDLKRHKTLSGKVFSHFPSVKDFINYW